MLSKQLLLLLRSLFLNEVLDLEVQAHDLDTSAAKLHGVLRWFADDEARKECILVKNIVVQISSLE